MTNEKLIQAPLLHGQPEKYLTSRLTLCEGLAEPQPEPTRIANDKPSAEKMKNRKKERNDRLIAALINSIGRIFAQIIGAVAGVVLGIAIAGQMTGTHNGYQVNHGLPIVPAEPQRLSQPVEFVGQIPDRSQVLGLTRDAPPAIVNQRSITARRVVIINTGTGEFIVYIEPAERHP